MPDPAADPRVAQDGAEAQARFDGALSIVVEWDNPRLSEVGRARAMLQELRAQLAAARLAARPEILVLYDPDAVEPGLVETVLAEAAGGATGPNAWPADLRIETAPGLRYYEQKNRGAALSRGDVVLFLDSDVIPEPGWLDALLDALADPAIAVVGGVTFLTAEDFYSRAFALFWFFPLRRDASGVERKASFYANNVAMRRAVTERFPFPDAPVFRGQCTLLGDRLAEAGVPIHVALAARVSHPAPNGLRHFLHRALCEGHDLRVMTPMRPGAGGWGASPLWAVGRAASASGRACLSIARRRRAVGLGPVGAVGATALALAYYGLRFVGEIATFLDPALIRDNFET